MLETFKGVALFTPGGDFFYAINASKQGCWHWQLCECLQTILDLPAKPDFLLPSHTATIDRWRNPRTHQLQTFAEVYPSASRHQPLLNAAFGTEDWIWRIAPWEEAISSPLILEPYRAQFPQLWQNHDLVVKLGTEGVFFSTPLEPAIPQNETTGYVLRLFVSGSNSATQRTLEATHQVLEKGFQHPYTLKVIDIAKHPEQAEIHQIIATPTLVRVYPEPTRRLVGELALTDWQRVVAVLSAGYAH